MFEGSERSSGFRLRAEYLSPLLSLIGYLSVSTPVTGMNVSLAGGGGAAGGAALRTGTRAVLSAGCWACSCFSVPCTRIAAVSKEVLRMSVSFRDKWILLGRASSDRLRCF